jgi:hypothetical protein
MPRKARIDAPGAVHHIIVRGIERSILFRGDKDRNDFLTRLGKILVETKTRLQSTLEMAPTGRHRIRTGKA